MKILYFISVDWFFVTHFLDRAMAAKAAGFEVVVVTAASRHRERIEASGIRFIDLDVGRKSIGLASIFISIARLIRILKIERPDVIHNVALKPIIIGSIATKFSIGAPVVNAVVGMGYIFSSQDLTARLLRIPTSFMLRLVLNPKISRVVFENRDDLKIFVGGGYVRASDAVLIGGAGVDLSVFSKNDVLSEVPTVVLPARLLWDKGIGEFVEAVKLLKRSCLSARFVVVGGVDVGNRSAIDPCTLDVWRRQGDVEFWGYQEDMARIFGLASIVCLPSYREGLPKALLEGMAAGLPCVTTDVPGCREAVVDGVNGVLVPPRNPELLAAALKQLIMDPELRSKMGALGNEMALTKFCTKKVQAETLEVYKSVLS